MSTQTQLLPVRSPTREHTPSGEQARILQLERELARLRLAHQWLREVAEVHLALSARRAALHADPPATGAGGATPAATAPPLADDGGRR
jgi:hypothetical protein